MIILITQISQVMLNEMSISIQGSPIYMPEGLASNHMVARRFE